ncbi:PREDICTED: uncharacterized protein LOC107340539 [Acropora digitifera]|uniref:uncharacterized protein LOC107340539 n=1 Tax=Acropora digitifera TaxID=70779 RepID=UPI00077A53E1|nr:PREDICTED: uncharacterized protein LOC107340539 [Acropora digitifera]
MRARKTTVIAVIFQIFFLYASCYGIISYKTPQEARKASSRQVNHFSDGKSSDHVLVSDEDVDLAQEEYRDRCKVFCLQNNMILVIPKPLLRGADREHIRALDLNCKASENQTHFVLDVPLTGCGTNSRHSVSSVIYSNEALPAPPSARELVSHVPNFEIPFYCYYDNSGVVTGVGLRPESKKVIFSQKGFGKFSLSLELYPDESFAGPYRQKDYPVTKKLREKIFFKASVDTIDDRLTILAKECYATPSQDKNSRPKYWIIHNGCKMDDTVDYIPSDRKSDKFSLETFKFINENAFIFLHCQVRVCNASDEQSKCARVCEGRRRRDVTVSAETADDVYPLAQGPITLEKEQEVRGQKTKTPARSSGTNVPVTTMLAVLIVLFVIAMSYILCQRETEVDKYNKLIEEIRDYPLILLPLGPCLRGKGCLSEDTEKEFFHCKSKMRSLVLLASVIIFSSAEDRAVNVDVPDIGQPGSACSPFTVGPNVTVTEATCLQAPSPPGTRCTLSCPPHLKLTGPPYQQCGSQGVWSPPSGMITCKDIDECKDDNGGCSHECVNDYGGHHCACPEPLQLSDDDRNCRAVGLVLNCSTHAIEVTVPKTALRDLQGDFLSLLDPKCPVIETPTHYIFETALDKCGTKRRSTVNFIAYSNRIVERKVSPGSIITRVGEDEFDIPFCCYYLNNGITSSVGMKPKVKQLYLNENGYGRFSIRMDFYNDEDYQSKYSWDDFPVEVAYRERLYFEVSIVTLDQSLQVMAANCCSTPTADHNKEHRFRHELIHEGCPVDDTVKMVNSSSKQSQRFSVEAWKFVGEFPFVYLHCSVVVCKAGDLDSRCSKGCIPGLHVNPPYAVMEKLNKQSQGRVKRELVENKDPEYLISKGPFSLNEATVDDGSEISLKGPQQDQSKMEVKEGTGENKGWDQRVTNGMMVVIAVASMLAFVGVIHITRVMKRSRRYKIVNQS